MKKYYAKAPTSGWHEVGEDGYKAFIQFLRENATPCGVTIEQLIKLRTSVEEVTP